MYTQLHTYKHTSRTFHAIIARRQRKRRQPRNIHVHRHIYVHITAYMRTFHAIIARRQRKSRHPRSTIAPISTAPGEEGGIPRDAAHDAAIDVAEEARGDKTRMEALGDETPTEALGDETRTGGIPRAEAPMDETPRAGTPMEGTPTAETPLRVSTDSPGERVPLPPREAEKPCEAPRGFKSKLDWGGGVGWVGWAKVSSRAATILY